MNAKLVLVPTLSVVGMLGFSQLTFVSVRSNNSGEISFETAVQRFKADVTALGFTEPRVNENQSRIVRSGFGSKYALKSESGLWTADVDAVSGRLLSLYNQKRRREQYKGIGRSGVQYFTSEQAAKNHLRMVATKLGMPTEAVFSKLTWKRDGEVKDASTAGSVFANYRIPGRETFVVGVDPQDGVFVSYVRTVKQP